MAAVHVKASVVALVLGAAAGAAGMRALTPPSAAVRNPDQTTVSFGTSGSPLPASASKPTPRLERRGSLPAVVVYVAGAVAKPGVYTLAPTARAVDALRAAGGATAEADLVAVDLAQHVEDGQEIAVPLRGAARAGGRSGQSAAPGARSRPSERGSRHVKRRRKKAATETEDGSASAEPTEVVDVNDADAATLETLPGIGPSLAQRLIAFRDLNGPFASVDDLLDIGGMTAGKVEALAPYVIFK